MKTFTLYSLVNTRMPRFRLPSRPFLWFILISFLAFSLPGRAVELRMSRPALERTLKQQLFSGPDGRYYLKGNARSACSVYAEKPELRFVGDRVVVQVKIQARLGKSLAGRCIGVS